VGGRWRRHFGSTPHLRRSASHSMILQRTEGGRWQRNRVNTSLKWLKLRGNGLGDGGDGRWQRHCISTPPLRDSTSARMAWRGRRAGAGRDTAPKHDPYVAQACPHFPGRGPLIYGNDVGVISNEKIIFGGIRDFFWFLRGALLCHIPPYMHTGAGRDTAAQHHRRSTSSTIAWERNKSWHLVRPGAIGRVVEVIGVISSKRSFTYR
jgi:hypothetical protein